MPHETLFTRLEFVEAISRSIGSGYQPLAIPIAGSGPARTMYAAAKPAPYRSRYVALAPFSLYASPGWDGELQRTTLESVVNFLQGPRTRGFVWNVRFDHADLAAGLASFGMASESAPSLVIGLDQGYARVAARYSATIRNEIRKAYRRDVSVREAQETADVLAYYELHDRLVQQKEWRGYHYPLALFLELFQLRDSVRLLLAEHEGRIVSGAVFLRDAESVLYWHAASNRTYSHLFASRPILDEAIRWACESSAGSLDLGGSAGIASLEQFKASWGALPRTNWTFRWTNPLWRGLSVLKAKLVGQRASTQDPTVEELQRAR